MSSSLINRPPFLAIDPGREKCGLAVVNDTRRVLEQEIVDACALPLRIAHFIGKYGIEMVVLGDRTGSREVRDSLRSAGLRMDIVFVDEDRSSELGRHRYLRANPPRGWRRLLPIGLRTPSRAYDDYVAVILAERYLDGSRSSRRRRARRPPAMEGGG